MKKLNYNPNNPDDYNRLINDFYIMVTEENETIMNNIMKDCIKQNNDVTKTMKRGLDLIKQRCIDTDNIHMWIRFNKKAFN